MAKKKPVLDQTPTEAFLEKAHKGFQIEAEASASIRKQALEDLRFLTGEQWDEEVLKARTDEGMPSLCINQWPKFMKQVVNEVRQSNLGIKVDPWSDGARQEVAEIIGDIIRRDEYDSSATVAYKTAAEYAIACGFGYFRLRADYEDYSSFHQRLVVDRIPNPFLVYMGAGCQKLDYSDAKRAYIIEDIPKDEYELLYPDSDLAGRSDFTSIGDSRSDWASQDTIRVAEYFYIDEQEATLCKLADGTTAFLDKIPAGAKIVSKRPSKKCVVKWAKINATEILEERDLPGTRIPIFPILGHEVIVNGVRILEGLLRYSRDPQIMYNLQVSSQAQMIALAPKAPYQITPIQEQGFEEEYETANRGNKAVLHYNPDPSNPGPPQRQMVEPAIQAISVAIQQARNDLQDTAAIYNAGLGQTGPEISGAAIDSRKLESDTANFHFIDNVEIGLASAGRVYIEYIQTIYDTPRVLHILGIDQQPRQVTVNQPFVNDQGVQQIFDLTEGKYGLSISTGPNYASQRKAAAAGMMQLAQAYPPLMQVAGDLVVKAMDWPGAEGIAERLKKALPPQLQDQQPQPIPPEVQAHIQQLTQALNEAQNFVATDQAKQQANIQIAQLNAQKELKLKAMDIEAKITIAQITAGNAEAQAQADREYGQLDTLAGFAHAAGMANMQHAHGQIAAQASAQRQQVAQAQQQAQPAQQQPQPGGVSEQ